MRQCYGFARIFYAYFRVPARRPLDIRNDKPEYLSMQEGLPQRGVLRKPAFGFTGTAAGGTSSKGSRMRAINLFLCGKLLI
jgi:hypothetical protein